MDAGPPNPAVTPRQALVQLVVLVSVFYAVVYGGALMSGFASKLEHPVLSVSLLSSLMLLMVAWFSRRDAAWRRSLALAPQPLLTTLAWGGGGVLACYGINIALTLGYTILTTLAGGSPQALATQKAQWATQLGSQVSLAWVLPLAIAAGVWEEIAFRGFVLGRLRVMFSGQDPRWRDGLAVGVSAALFGLGHGYQGAFGLLQTATIGAVLGVLVLRRGSLWPAMVAHLSIDGIGLFTLHVARPLLEKAAHGGL